MPAAPRRYLILAVRMLPAVIVCHRYLIVVPRPLPAKPQSNLVFRGSSCEVAFGTPPPPSSFPGYCEAAAFVSARRASFPVLNCFPFCCCFLPGGTRCTKSPARAKHNTVAKPSIFLALPTLPCPVRTHSRLRSAFRRRFVNGPNGFL
jgi:hypothetical protein